MILKGKGDELKHKRCIGTGRRDRRKETWKRTGLKYEGKCGKTWGDVKRLAGVSEMLHRYLCS